MLSHQRHGYLIPICILFFCLLASSATSQSRIEIYKAQIETAETDSIRSMLFLYLAKSFNDLDSTLYYTKKSMSLAREIDNISCLAESHYLMGWVCFRKSELKEAIAYYETALTYFEKEGYPEGIGKSMVGISQVYQFRGDLDQATESIMLAIEILESTDRLHSLANAYLALGDILRQDDQLGQSMEYNRLALQKYKEANFEEGVIGMTNNISLIYSEEGQYDSSIFYLKKLLTEHDLDNHLELKGIVLNNLGKDYRKLEKYDSAIKFTKLALEVLMQTKSDYDLALAQTNLADAYLKSGQINSGLEAIQKSYGIIKNSDNRREKSRATLIYSQLLEATGKYKEAIDYLRKHMVLEDSLYSNQKTKDIAELEKKYNLDKKEQEIITLTQEKEIADLRKNLLGGVIAFIVVAGIFLFSYLHQRNRKNRLLLQKEKEVDETKSRFFANISHEFRTPLTLILGPIEEIKSKVSDSQILLYLDLMKKNAHRLLTQVNQLLDLSKLDSGVMQLNPEKDDIVRFVRQVTMLFESLAQSRNIELTFQSSADSIIANFDKESIEKIVTNLLSNALKFTDGSGSVMVEVSEFNEQIQIQVSDSGRGIMAEDKERIFERYYHTESDIQRSSGIGLALVKELVDAQGGSIHLESEKDKGSKFTVTLKKELKSIPVSQAQSPDQEETDTMQNDSTQKRVLIIEDNEDVRTFVRESLSRDLEILETASGEEGISKAMAEMPDLIITDIMMGEMDGYEVLKTLKSDEKTSHIPVIMLTAKSDKGSKLKGLDYHADDFIVKPFDKKELLSRIQNLIQSRERLKEKFSIDLTLKPKELNISSIDQVFIEKLLVIVEENMGNSEFSVEDMAHEVGMSRSQLHRKLQAIIGQPPNKFIRNMRLQRASELLKSKAGTVSEIAYMTGFTSPNYFSKCFHDQYGHAPGEVAKK